MYFEQALKEMSLGKRIRLSDWSGYWFMDNITDQVEIKIGSVSLIDTSLIRVFTRDGNILDTPNINLYCGRDDWQIDDEKGWSFDMALRFLKTGKHLTRSSWNTTNSIFMSFQEFYLDYSVDYKATEYVFSSKDLLATDWQIVNV